MCLLQRRNSSIATDLPWRGVVTLFTNKSRATTMKTPNNRIGLIWPSDGVLDSELWQFAPAHASLHFTRTQVIDEPISLSLVERMAEDTDIDYGAETLRPISPAVVTYACTSGSFVLGIDGEKQLLDRIERSANAPSTTTSTALAAACHALGLERVAVAAPYIAEITDRLASFLEAKDIKVSKVTSMGLSHGIGDVSDEEVIQLGLEANDAKSDGLVISCTNLRTADIIERLEGTLGKPVISANQATMWHACQIGQIDFPDALGIGKLFELPAITNV